MDGCNQEFSEKLARRRASRQRHGGNRPVACARATTGSSGLDRAFADDDRITANRRALERTAADRHRQVQQTRAAHLVALLNDDVMPAVAAARRSTPAKAATAEPVAGSSTIPIAGANIRAW